LIDGQRQGAIQMRRTRAWQRIATAASIAALASCRSATDLPESGAIAVAVATTGPEPDRNGYRVVVDGSTSRTVGVEDSTSFEQLTPGSHAVELTDVADNCSVSGGAPRSITVVAGAIERVRFEIACAATGALRVVTHSRGSPADPDGYQLGVTGRGFRPIGADESIIMTGFLPGSVSVQLAGVAANCTVGGAGTDARRVTVVASDTMQETFEVSCAALPPPPGDGSILVSVSTTVVNAPVPNGYTVTVDGTRPTSVAASGSVTLAHVLAGVHSVKLSGMPPWCGVGFGPFLPGLNPVPVPVTAGGVARVSFGVFCLG
jgi:hypothetical protein